MSFTDGLLALASSTQDTGMSFGNRIMLWFHVLFVVFTVGPVTLAVMSSPRAIRTRNVAVLRYLLWMTRIFGAATLGVFAFGMALGQSLNDLGQAWLTASMTLYVVAVAVLLLIMRDQRRAIAALETARQKESLAEAAAAATTDVAAGQPGTETEQAAESPAPEQTPPAIPPAAAALHVATVERGRIASMGGIVSVIWLVILVLMIWHS